jgi:hypothetical protein
VQLSLVVDVKHHRKEKRLPSVKDNLSALSCAWAKVCGPKKPDHLLYSMKLRYCIKCNRQHWFFLEQLEYTPIVFNPNDYDILALQEMGYFDQFQDADTR